MRWKDFIKCVVCLVCIISISCLFYFLPDTISLFITDSSYRNNHFNLLSIASILAGFMFTAISMLVGISDKKIMRVLAQTTILDKKQSRMIRGAKVDIGCVVLSAIFVLGIDVYLPDKLKIMIIAIEIFLFVLGVYYLYKAIIDVLNLLNLIKPKREIPNELLEKMKERIDKY